MYLIANDYQVGNNDRRFSSLQAGNALLIWEVITNTIIVIIVLLIYTDNRINIFITPPTGIYIHPSLFVIFSMFIIFQDKGQLEIYHQLLMSLPISVLMSLPISLQMFLQMFHQNPHLKRNKLINSIVAI